MYINKIKFNEKKFLFDVNIQIDEKIEEKYQISYEVYESLELKENLEINKTIYQNIIDENNYQKAKKIAENYINYKFRSSKEVNDKLYKSGIKDGNIIERVINHYIKLSLIDDERYAKEYIDYLLNIKNSSITFTKYKLKEKGINDSIFSKYLEDYNNDIEYENAIYIFDKKYTNIDLEDQKSIQKVYRYLSSKGFKYDIIKRIIDERK